MHKKILPIILLALIFSACTKEAPPEEKIAEIVTSENSASSNYQLSNVTVTTKEMNIENTQETITTQATAVIKTNKGTMKVVLHPEWAPNTVQNFIDLAKGEKISPATNTKVSNKPYYDGIVFHRIIKDFMIQGGDPTGTGSGGPGYKFADEKVIEDYTKGTIAMANAGPNTNGSQFFIMTTDYALPKNYTIFGRIDPSDKESLATLDKIASTPVAMSDMGELSTPKEKVYMESVTIEE